ncbi:MAG: hypothetical protein COA58_08060 [Bacteroidetes bacterium]|nr:MAG: hypothetical protein COA58_08060 [Bacteroidota bacterium]
MKKITKLGLVAFASILLLASACKKSPSSKIYNTWSLDHIEMPEADSFTLARMAEADVTYTFKKDGTYSYDMMGTTGSGTFEINEEGTSMTTDEEGEKEVLGVMLTESSLQLSKGNDKMMFSIKK